MSARLPVALRGDYTNGKSGILRIQMENPKNVPRPDWDADLSAMAGDPDIQREIRKIEAEFMCTEMDGLWEQEELERRLAAHKASPADVVPWEEVKSQALARARNDHLKPHP